MTLASRIAELITAIGADVKTIRTRRRSITQIYTALVNSALAAGTYVLLNQTVGAVLFSGANTSAVAAFYIDPAAFKSSDKLRLEAWRIGNSISPGAAISWTFGLYPVTFTRASNVIPTLVAGPVIAGSQIPVANPGANGEDKVLSNAFDIPAAGWYALGFVQSAANATNATASVAARLYAEST